MNVLLCLQVFEGTSGIDNKHTTIEFTGEVNPILSLSECLSFFYHIFLFLMMSRFLCIYRQVSSSVIIVVNEILLCLVLS